MLKLEAVTTSDIKLDFQLPFGAVVVSIATDAAGSENAAGVAECIETNS